MTINPRQGAVLALLDIEEQGAYASLALDRVLRGFSFTPQDRAFLTNLVYGTVQWRGTIDYYLQALLKAPLVKTDPVVREILRVSAYQLLFLRVPARAAVDEGVKLTRLFKRGGLAGLVNGVLRNLLRRKDEIRFPDRATDPVGYLTVACSHPRWLVERWVKRYGIDFAEQLCRANNETPPLSLRVNMLKINREQCIRDLTEAGLDARPAVLAPEGVVVKNGGDPERWPGFSAGHFLVQDEASMLVARALGALPGERVIDVTGAPGGKGTHLAEMMENTGEVFIGDIHEHRLELVRENARRLGLYIVRPWLHDAREVDLRLVNSAHRVLVDAPCSGLGVLRRKPDTKWRREEEDIRALSTIQRAILSAAAAYVRPGGIILYSTCTLEPEENGQVVQAFLTQNPAFSLTDFPADFPVTNASGFVQLYPHIHGTDGFFMARMQKRE